jgi:hypothetical protein
MNDPAYLYFLLAFSTKVEKNIFNLFHQSKREDPFILPKVFTQQRRHSAIPPQYTTTLTHSPRAHPI